MCRFGRQSLQELMGRKPNALEMGLFTRAIQKLLDEEYSNTPQELRTED